MNAHLLQPAFVDPVLDAQRGFRTALKALAEPGLIQHLPSAPRLDGLAPATYALCLALLDMDTPLWLAPSFDTPLIRANLAFHCACPLTDKREDAVFALLGEQDLLDLSCFDHGNDRYPDQSCTLLVQLTDLEAGRGLQWHGPGIKTQRQVHLPVPQAFWQERQRREAFPRGLDVLFAAGHHLIGLPRSSRIAQEHA